MSTTLNLQRPAAPVQSPVLNQAGFAHPDWALFHTTVGDITAMGPTLYDTHANRINIVPGTPPYYGPGRFLRYLFYETDRGSLYLCELVSGIPAWVWITGAMSCTQANLPAGLGVNDTGFIAQVTDYNHRLLWSGSAWGWAPGDAGSGMMVLFEVDPSPATGWHLYDGAVGLSYLKSDGTLGTVTLPDLTSAANKAAYPKAGSPNSAVNVAAGHAHDAPIGDDGLGNIFELGVNGVGANYTAINTVAGTPNANLIPALKTSVDSTAEPQNVVRRPWFRQ